MSETVTINHVKPPVSSDQFEYKNLKQGEFWRHIPAYKDVDEATFLDHLWQQKNAVKTADRVCSGPYMAEVRAEVGNSDRAHALAASIVENWIRILFFAPGLYLWATFHPYYIFIWGNRALVDGICGRQIINVDCSGCRGHGITPQQLTSAWPDIHLRSTVREVCALSDLDNVSIRIADVAANLAILRDWLGDELGSSTFP